VEQKGQVSPDGQLYWDGQKWASTLSPDGAWRWDGQDWVASGVPGSRPISPGISHASGLRGVSRWKLASAGVVGLVFLGFIGNAIGHQPPSNSTAQVAAVSPTATAQSEAARPAVVRTTPSPTPTHPPSPSPSPTPTLAPSPPPPAPATSAPVASTDPYPAATAAGASAVCADGSWSFSKTRSGTCSHHGGVHWWTGNLGPAGPGAH
jgi:hypothetical protein